MIISPPFLPDRGTTQTYSNWLDTAMNEVATGRFPLSTHASWHGGVHLEAPSNATGRLPVCAIADGEVVFVRQPLAKSTDVNHAQNYNPNGSSAWTDSGCVVIKHTTEVGADAVPSPTTFVYYSIYMHLSAVDAGITDPITAPPQKLYRKQMIGTAGEIYGEAHRIHFEIICDDANLNQLLGRTLTIPTTTTTGTSRPTFGDVALTRNGQTNAIYGERYFYLPTGTSVFSRSEVEYRLALDDAQQAATTARPPTTPPTSLPNPPTQTHTTTQDLIVGITFVDGNAVVNTYDLMGARQGAAITEPEFEYNIFTNAGALKKYIRLRNSDAGQPSNPVPTESACLDLLQFGRIIGPDALNPADTPNWHNINVPGGGAGWVNLNAAGIFKFSDADFPHWKHWTFINETVGDDSRCDDRYLRNLIDGDGDGQLSETEANPINFSQSALAQFAKIVARFPTEWNAADLITRWSWLKTTSPENPNPLNDVNFARFLDHARSLCFWDASLGITSVHWHLPPKATIDHCKKCAWLSAFELAQCIPRQCILGATSWNSANTRATNHRIGLNKMLRKYGLATDTRIIHMLAQIFIETGLLRLVVEGGSGAGHAYAAFFGRGFMQLTWPRNFENYGNYRALPNHTGTYADARITATSTHIWDSGSPAQVWSPRYDPDLVGTNMYAAADSGGFYWVSKTFRGTSNINRAADIGLETNVVGFISWLVNGGGNGYNDRQEYARYLHNLLHDEPLRSGRENWTFQRLGRSITSSFPPGTNTATANVNINYATQRP